LFTLKKTLLANVTSCCIFGLIFLLLPLQTSLFLSASDQAPELVIFILGCVLLFNAVHLIWASFQAMHNKYLILYFSLGDLIWVIISLILLVSELWITTTAGIISTTLVSIIVGTFGLLQFIKIKDL